MVNADEVLVRAHFHPRARGRPPGLPVPRRNRVLVFCRRQDVAMSADRALEREAHIFVAELLMPPNVGLGRALRWTSCLARTS